VIKWLVNLSCWGEWVACVEVMVEQLKTVFKLYKMKGDSKKELK